MPDSFEVILDIKVSDFLRNLDKGESIYLREILGERLSAAPKDYGSPLKGKKLRGVWKLRTSRWRIFYEIDEGRRHVNVLLIDSRDEGTYRRLERKLGNR